MSDFSSLKGMRKKKDATRSFAVGGGTASAVASDLGSGSGPKDVSKVTSDSSSGSSSTSTSVFATGAVSASVKGVEVAMGMSTTATGAASASTTTSTPHAGDSITSTTPNTPAAGAAVSTSSSVSGTLASAPMPKPTDMMLDPPGQSSRAAGADVDIATPNLNDTERYDTQGLYRELPKDYLEIRQTREHGRGVWAKAALRPGQTLISIKPHSTALSNDNLNNYCSKCCAPPAGDDIPLMRCTGCRVVQYCDSKCQAADWTMHKHECARLQTWISHPPPSSSSGNISVAPTRTTIPGDAVRCLGRILARKKKLGKDSVWVREIEGLGSHRKSIAQSPTSHDAQMHSQLAHAVVRFLGIGSLEEMKEFGIGNSAELVDVVSQFTTNTFTLASPALVPLGVCVSPLIALFNHSCEPNAVVVFPRDGRGKGKSDDVGLDPMMHVVVIKDIGPGEEVVTAYIDTTLPRERRRRYLKETYYFDCDCGVCREGERGRGVLTGVSGSSSSSSSLSLASVAGPSSGVSSYSGLNSKPGETTVDLREAMWCPKRCGGVCWVPTEENTLTRCSRCKSAVKDTDAVLDAMHVGQQALDKAEALQFSDPQKSIQLTTKLIPILISAGLHPSAHPLLALSRLETSLLIEQLGGGVQKSESVYGLDGDGMDVDFSPQSTNSTPTTSTPSQILAQSALDDTIRSATRTSTGLSQILTYGHPVRGVALAELGKLLCVDEVVSRWGMEGGAKGAGASAGVGMGMSAPSSPFNSSSNLNLGASNTNINTYPPSGPPRLNLALQTLIQARSELMVGFGNGSAGRKAGMKFEGGKVGEEVRELIVGVEREVGVWKEGFGRGIREVREGRARAR